MSRSSGQDRPTHPYAPLVTGEAGTARSKPKRSRTRRLAGGCASTVLFFLQVGIVMGILAVAGVIAGYFYLSDELSDAINQVVTYQGQGPGGTPRFYDRNGNLLMELKTAEKRRWLSYQEIPVDVINATVAVEDDTFWQNLGFDPEAILAALVSNYRNPEERPAGASTITQQLVRHIVFTYEERLNTSYERKLRELFLALILTQQRSKQDIMTMYLNEIYYGNLAYGIEAAAQTYFGKPASELQLAEAALLAGLPQAPGILDPYTNLEGARERQEFVLDLMVSEGMVEASAAEDARKAPLMLAPLLPTSNELQNGQLEAPHFVLYVQSVLEQRYGPEALTRGGWQITTSLDLGLQRYVEQAAREWIASRSANNDVNNAAIVVMKPGTGEILAMVGSLDYFNESIDGQVNVALMPRQPGSAIKPVTYAAAMERGWSTGDVIWDVPIELDLGGGQTMIPVNYDGRYHGPLLLRDALANSYNIPPVQLIRDIGISSFIATGRKMGIDSLKEPPGFYGLALTLGGGEVPLLEMTHAYATLANMGKRPRLTPVVSISDSRGGFVYSNKGERLPAVNAVDARIAYVLTDILDDDAARVPAMGRNNALNLPFPAAAKTGTTTDFRDNWTLGYTPNVVVGVWVGNTDGHPMRSSSGLYGAAPLWRQIMEHIYNDPAITETIKINGLLQTDFIMPPGIEERSVCLPRGTGGSTCTASRTDLFLVGGPVHAVQRLGYIPDMNTNPGAWTVAVAALSAADAQRISLPPTDSGFRMPVPTTCVVNSARPPDGVATRLMLAVPPYYPDEVKARIWARQAGYVMAPHSACPTGPAYQFSVAGGEAAGGAAGGGTAGTAAVWQITSPTPGQQVSGMLPILGTVTFDPARYQYYKLEIGSGPSPATWTTFGTTHAQNVNNGVLESLHAYALPPGDYTIRLVLVGSDGNYPPPHAIPITIVP